MLPSRPKHTTPTPTRPTPNFINIPAQAERRGRVDTYRQLLRSLGVDGRSRWTPLAADAAAHPAGAALGEEEREGLFREYVAELRVGGHALLCVAGCVGGGLPPSWAA